MIISDKKKFIFVHIYKTAGSSVRRRLEWFDASYNLYHWGKSKFTKYPVLIAPLGPKHSDAKTIRNAVGPEVYDSYFSFCFVRNPWDWQVSLYHYVLRSENNHHYDIIKNFKGFEDYIHWRCNEDVHFQKDFVLDEEGNQIVNFIGRMENLNQDFNTICKKLDLNLDPLPHLNKSVNKSYKDFYTPETSDLVYQAFQPDIDYFGYDFD